MLAAEPTSDTRSASADVSVCGSPTSPVSKRFAGLVVCLCVAALLVLAPGASARAVSPRIAELHMQEHGYNDYEFGYYVIVTLRFKSCLLPGHFVAAIR